MSFDKFGLQIAQVSNLVFNLTLYQKKLIIFNVNLKDQGCSVHHRISYKKRRKSDKTMKKSFNHRGARVAEDFVQSGFFYPTALC
jgi:hypothetical protein